VSLLVQAQNNLGYEDLGALLSLGQWPEPHMGGGSGCTTAEPSPNGGPIRLWMNGPCHAAAEFLAATESYTNAFEIIRRAFERPYGRIDGDYRMPLLVPHPHWVVIRNMAQSLCSRAQCYLLLGKPEAAWDELKLAWELHRLSEANPPGRPMTMLGAMLNVAMVGLYVCTIQDGLRLHAWRESQLLAIERELKQADLLSDATHAWRISRAASPDYYQITRLRDLRESTSLGERVAAFARSVAPRGWQYQKLAVSAEVTQAALDSVDLTNQLVIRHRFDDALQKLRSKLKCTSTDFPWAPAAAPNLQKMLLTVTHKQTMVNLARIACMLERYRLAHKQYPATLDEVAADLKEQLPHDIINGQPFRYRFDPSGHYILYSVGWNEKEDGAAPGKSIDEGDWVWESEPKRP